jgi:hypothetical protein
MMPKSIFDFWSHIDRRAPIHPSDEWVILQDKHDLDVDRYLPQPFLGPLKTAPIVLLYLSPGTSPLDRDESKSEAEISRCERQRQGNAALPSKDEHPAAWKWWTSRTKWLGTESNLRTKLAILELGAYHSKNGYAGRLLALPSSRVAVEWAQSVLFPSAISGEKLVICMRSPKYWGLRAGTRYGAALFAPATNRGGHLLADVLQTEIKAIAQRFLS